MLLALFIIPKLFFSLKIILLNYCLGLVVVSTEPKLFYYPKLIYKFTVNICLNVSTCKKVKKNIYIK